MFGVANDLLLLLQLLWLWHTENLDLFILNSDIQNQNNNFSVFMLTFMFFAKKLLKIIYRRTIFAIIVTQNTF